MMKAILFGLVLAVTIPAGFFSPAPLDRLIMNLNIPDSPRAEEEDVVPDPTMTTTASGPVSEKEGPAMRGEQMDKKRKRILGDKSVRYYPSGDFIDDRDFPVWENFMASLKIYNDEEDPDTGAVVRVVELCSGVLISKRHILTALHCIMGGQDLANPLIPKDDVNIYFDRENLRKWTGTMFKAMDYFYVGKPTVQYYYHPDGQVSPKDDIAVIKLDREIEDTDQLVPVKISTIKPYNLNGEIEKLDYWMAGWGYNRYDPWELPDFLHHTNSLEGVPCPLTEFILNTNANMCFLNYNYVAATCGGDSGSPGLISIDEEWHVQGIHTGREEVAGYATYSCNETESIQVDSDVSVYKDLIDGWIRT